MAKAKNKGETKDDLAHLIADTLNNEDIDTYFIGEEETPTDLTDFISTGSSLLDIAISNRKNGGIPCGRITELNGLEGSGKSLVCGHLMKSVQDEGGLAVLIDTEAAVNEEFFRSIGLDFSRMVYVSNNIIEDIFASIEKIVTKVREGSDEARKKKIIIVFDSIAGASTKREMEADFNKDGYATDKALIIGKAMRKLTTLLAKQKIALVVCNQLRQKMNAQPFADPWTTPGGKALGFHASVRIRLSMTGKIQNANKEVIGVTVSAKIIKNRVGPPHRQADFDVYFDRGIDDVTSWIKYLKDSNVVSGAVGRYTFVDSKGTEHKFQTSTWQQFVKDNPEVFNEIYNKVAETMIMRYKSDGLSTLDNSVQVTPAIETGDE